MPDCRQRLAVDAETASEASLIGENCHIRKALSQANVDPLDVQYVEAHGTGTALGDPIELEALGEALCQNRQANQPLIVGSVKTNIGHLESAAGIAGLIKTVLAMQRGQIPPHLHLVNPNPHVRWDRLPIEVPRIAADVIEEQRRQSQLLSEIESIPEAELEQTLVRELERMKY